MLYPQFLYNLSGSRLLPGYCIESDFCPRENFTMNKHAELLQDRLRQLFENKATEFVKFAQDNPNTAVVTSQIAEMYTDLARVMSI